MKKPAEVDTFEGGACTRVWREAHSRVLPVCGHGRVMRLDNRAYVDALINRDARTVGNLRSLEVVRPSATVAQALTILRRAHAKWVGACTRGIGTPSLLHRLE